MKYKMKQIIALIMALAVCVGLIPVPLFSVKAQAADTTFKTVTNSTDIVRYTVVILDTSSSMYGKPEAVQKQAAIKFCESVTNANGKNYVAIVNLNASSSIGCDFTDKIVTLKSYINSIPTGGGTNIYQALQIAGNLLDNISDTNTKKNIVLCSDGLPESGTYTDWGKYTNLDHNNYYKYGNPVYNIAQSLKENKYTIYTLGFFHSLSGKDLSFGRQLMTDIASLKSQYYEVTNADEIEFVFDEIAEEVTGAGEYDIEFNYASGSERDYTATCHYKDSYFYNASYGRGKFDGYNPSLATASLCFALSCFGSNDGGDKDYTHKYKNVEEFLTELNFTNFDYNDWFTKKPQNDSIGVASARKPITVEGKKYTLIAVAVRGGGYESEWAGNFTIGKTGQHYGFSTAKKQVIDYLQNYICEQEITGDVKLWITGYSRAAATANLVAGEIDNGTILSDNITLMKEDVYAYCFETPMGALKSEIINKSKYYNIYNIINKNDPVTKVAMDDLGFTRYGVDYYLPDSISDGKDYTLKKDAMLEFYKAMDSYDVVGNYNVDNFKMKKIDLKYILPGGKSVFQDDNKNKTTQAAFLDTVISKITVENIKSRDNYVNNYQNGIRIIFMGMYGTLFPDTPMERIMEFKNILIKKVATQNFLADVACAALNPFDKNKVKDVVYDIVTESLNEAGINNYAPSVLMEFVESITNLMISFVISHPNYTVTLIYNIGNLGAAHYPELCMAWLMSQDDEYTENAYRYNGSGNYRIIRINCPIDVEVYNVDGDFVASIVDNEAQKIEGSSILSTINEDDEKIVYLPANAEYTIKLIATDGGNMNFAINEYSSSSQTITRIQNYYDVSIKEGDILTANIPAYSDEDIENYDESSNVIYSLMNVDGTLIKYDEESRDENIQNETFYVNVQSNNDAFGIVSGQGTRYNGNFAKVEAIAYKGYKFNGWYVGEQLVSKNSEYRFMVTDDIKLTAYFEKDGKKQDEENTSIRPEETITEIKQEESKSDKNINNSSVNTGDSFLIIVKLLFFLIIAIMSVCVTFYIGKNDRE